MPGDRSKIVEVGSVTDHFFRQTDRTIDVLSLTVLTTLARLNITLERTEGRDSGLVSTPLAQQTGPTDEEEYGEVLRNEVIRDLDVYPPLSTDAGFDCTEIKMMVSQIAFPGG